MNKYFLVILAILLTVTGFSQVPDLKDLNKVPIKPGLLIKKDTAEPRFGVFLRDMASGAGAIRMPIVKVEYNLNPTLVQIGENSITIKKSGLYHFDFFLQLGALASKPLSLSLYLQGLFPLSSFMLLKDEVVSDSYSPTVYKGNWNFSFDVHLTAPVTFTPTRNLIGPTSTVVLEGNLLGYLVRE